MFIVPMVRKFITKHIQELINYIYSPSSSLKPFKKSLAPCFFSKVTTVDCSSLTLSSSLAEDDKDFSDDKDFESNLDSLVVGLG